MDAIPLSLRPALESLAARLRDRFGARLREVRLFGSYARGEAHESSDVDVLVLVDHLTPSEGFDVATEATFVELETGFPLSPLPMSTEHIAEMRRRERVLARVLDEEGIPP